MQKEKLELFDLLDRLQSILGEKPKKYGGKKSNNARRSKSAPKNKKSKDQKPTETIAMPKKAENKPVIKHRPEQTSRKRLDQKQHYELLDDSGLAQEFIKYYSKKPDLGITPAYANLITRFYFSKWIRKINQVEQPKPIEKKSVVKQKTKRRSQSVPKSKPKKITKAEPLPLRHQHNLVPKEDPVLLKNRRLFARKVAEELDKPPKQRKDKQKKPKTQQKKNKLIERLAKPKKIAEPPVQPNKKLDRTKQQEMNERLSKPKPNFEEQPAKPNPQLIPTKTEQKESAKRLSPIKSPRRHKKADKSTSPRKKTPIKLASKKNSSIKISLDDILPSLKTDEESGQEQNEEKKVQSDKEIEEEENYLKDRIGCSTDVSEETEEIIENNINDSDSNSSKDELEETTLLSNSDLPK